MSASTTQLEVRQYAGAELPLDAERWRELVRCGGPLAPSRHPAWPKILAEGLDQIPYLFEAVRDERIVGYLPLMYLRSLLFGRFLVSLPYLNSAGIVAEDQSAATALVDQAVVLADRLDVRYLELRHERAVPHAALNYQLTNKVHLRLELPGSAEALWKACSPKVRNQIRKGEKSGVIIDWGGEELLDDFYAVFSHNMRDLGTPVFSRKLFASMCQGFKSDAEICIARYAGRAIGGAILVHGDDVTEVPSASSLRRFNGTNANMLMYWHLLQRAIGRGQQLFDFGRSSVGSNTYRFKKQWGAEPHPAIWQYYVRQGNVAEMRPDNPRNQRLIRLWQKLPLTLANLFGPTIVRGIP